MKRTTNLILELLVIIAIVLVLRKFVVQAFNIPSASMQPTLLIGDFILVNKVVYRFSEPERGDIIVFKYPLEPSLDYIKRVVAKPGDTVEFVIFKDPEIQRDVYMLRVNGKDYRLIHRKITSFNGKFYYEYDEVIDRGDKEIVHRVWFSGSYDPLRFAGLTSYPEEGFCLKRFEGKCVKFVVPEDSYFVMGDNRDNSEDSRFWGFVPRENVVGKAFVIYFSGEVPALTPKDVNIFTGIKQLLIAIFNPRFERFGKPLIY